MNASRSRHGAFSRGRRRPVLAAFELVGDVPDEQAPWPPDTDPRDDDLDGRIPAAGAVGPRLPDGRFPRFGSPPVREPPAAHRCDWPMPTGRTGCSGARDVIAHPLDEGPDEGQLVGVGARVVAGGPLLVQ